MHNLEVWEAHWQGKTIPTSSEQRKARRQRGPRRTYEQGFRDATDAIKDFDFLGSDGPLAHFASLLPFEALKAAYRTASKLLHPDLGGDCKEMQLLNAAWARVEEHFKSKADTSPQEVAH